MHSDQKLLFWDHIQNVDDILHRDYPEIGEYILKNDLIM